jgi:hypothetical protein
VFRHEAKVAIGEAARRQDVPVRPKPDDVSGVAAEWQIVCKTALKPSQRRLVDLPAQKQIAIVRVTLDLFGAEHDSSLTTALPERPLLILNEMEVQRCSLSQQERAAADYEEVIMRSRAFS